MEEKWYEDVYLKLEESSVENAEPTVVDETKWMNFVLLKRNLTFRKLKKFVFFKSLISSQKRKMKFTQKKLIMLEKLLFINLIYHMII